MAALPKTQVSPTEYLLLERRAAFKSEYWDGEIYAMSGASREHNLITTNIITSLNSQLRARPCEVYPPDMRVRHNCQRYVYPDVTVVCGEPRFEDDNLDTLVNPTLIVEVLSTSTERFDRGKKFDSYRTIPSLQAYLMVAQDAPHLILYVRQADQRWLLSEAHDLDDILPLPPIECQLVLADVYNKIKFETAHDLAAE